MIRSMTGFGRGEYENEGREYLVEIKSVNHKYADISTKVPKAFYGIEYKIRKEVDNRVGRGKIDVFVDFKDNSSSETTVHFNKELAKIYVKNLIELGEEAGIKTDLNVIDISKMPDVFKRDDEKDEDLIYNEVKIALNIAIDKIIEMKEFEGNKLKEDIEKRLDILSNLVNEIAENSTGLVEQYIVKLEERVKELLKTETIDKDRLSQEIVYYSDKISIEEELTRLKSHIVQFREFLKNGTSPIEKKLDFLVQEINRETNTIGSKSGSLTITNLVVDLKTEIENIREQIQNIE